MPYRSEHTKGQTSSLHGKGVTLQNGRRQQIFSFARAPKAGASTARPAARGATTTAGAQRTATKR